MGDREKRKSERLKMKRLAKENSQEASGENKENNAENNKENKQRFVPVVAKKAKPEEADTQNPKQVEAKKLEPKNEPKPKAKIREPGGVAKPDEENEIAQPKILERFDVLYAYSKWPTDLSSCFVCKVGEVEGDKLMKCESKLCSISCPIRFHLSCIKKYNAGNFSYDCLKSINKKSSCPLHHCSYCYRARRKTAATHFGEGQECVTCIKCMQSFHETCLPGSAEVSDSFLFGKGPRYKSKAIVCPRHCEIAPKDKEAYKKTNAIISLPKEGKRETANHFEICSECEHTEPITSLVPCANCIRTFHKECHRVVIYNDNGVEKDAKTWCESCLFGDFVRLDTAAIAKFKGRFWPCIIRTTDVYPTRRSREKSKRFLSNSSFVVVEWGGCDATYGCLPISQVINISYGAYLYYGKKFKDKKYHDAWELYANGGIKSKEAKSPEQAFVLIATSVRNKARPQVKKYAFGDCECPKSGPDRCSTNACLSRLEGYECPKSCEEGPNGKSRICNNRSISNMLTAPGLEKRPAGEMGLGLFATEPLAADTFIAEYAGEIITCEEANKRIHHTQENRNNDEHHYMMDLNNGNIIDCKKKGNIARFLNHNCSPNCYAEIRHIVISGPNKAGEYKTDARVAITTKRKIKAEEELTFDYKMINFANGVVPDCHCKAANCRGKIGPVKTAKGAAK